MALRDELVISTKAGWDMWPGPYGEFGSRKYLLASLDQSLKRMGLDYVDIFYSHRVDPDTPLEETMGALDTAVRQGKALYVGISSYGPELTERACEILRELGTPLLIHQPSYSMLNRWIENGLLDTLEREGVGCIALLAARAGNADGQVPERRSRRFASANRRSLRPSAAQRRRTSQQVRALNGIAAGRGQSLAQMAIAWTLRDPRVTSALIGVSSIEQLEDNLGALDNLEFGADELAEIDRYARRGRSELWAGSGSRIKPAR